METSDAKLYERRTLLNLTCGNEEAASWIVLGREYIHLYDDIIDENLLGNGDKNQGVQRLIRLAAMAIELYTHTWFKKNSLLLSSVMMISNLHFSDSVEWEKSDIPWQRQCSDWFRHGWLDAVMLTAYLCGGYEHASKHSKCFKQIAWEQHHDEKGNPV